MQQKVHAKNGFEYTHDLFKLDGRWVRDWKFRPSNSQEWCPFYLPDKDAKKSDVENLLKIESEASAFYSSWLARASDVTAAEQRLSDARKHWERVSDPEWGGRGNNPNSDARTIRQARSELDKAESGIALAKAFRERINKS